MQELNADTERLLEALVDGQTLPHDEREVPVGLLKLAHLQLAFAQLQWAESAPATADPPVQFHWDRLSVLELLGEGGFGEVFRARDPVLQREVALKLRRSGDCFAPAAGRAFIEEARRLAQVRHPNVLAVHGAAVDRGRAGIWTDLIHGLTLADRVRRDGPLPADVVLQLLSMLSAALSAVHAKAIVHGDLKPANVMCETGSGRFVLMDFGAGARLDDSGRAMLATGSRHFMAPEQLRGDALGTAADLYSLGVTVYFAATGTVPENPGAPRLEARRDLPRNLCKLIRTLLNPEAEQRPSAASVVAECHQLLGEPERARRRRLRLALVMVLIGAVIASGIGLLFTINARSVAETERNRALTARDFLLSIMRSPNPYQTARPTRDLAVLFDHAVSALPAAFEDDSRTEAQLLQQFGRSLIILDQDAQAVRALERADQLFASLGDPIGASARIEARSFLSDAYRRRREYARAMALTDEQASLCVGADALPPATCVAIVNDQIEASGFGGDPHRALTLVQQNLDRVRSAGLESDYQSIFVVYLQGVMQRELGRSAASLRSFIELTERTLTGAPASHPGLLTDLMWLAWSADDLAQVALARELNDYVLRGRQALYGAVSRYTVEARLQAATLALHAGDFSAARVAAHALMAEMPKEESYAGMTDAAALIAALADDPEIDDAHLQSMELDAARALFAAAPKLAELRLGLAAVAVKRGQWARATELLDRAQAAVEHRNGSGLQASYWQLQIELSDAQSKSSATRLASARTRLNALLAQQQRRIFDPVRRAWVGPPVPSADASAAQIRELAQRVIARRASIDSPAVD
jgi:serine/threonine protein kinase